jgi:DNA helicase IV
VVEVAARVLSAAAPGLRPPIPVRRAEAPPKFLAATTETLFTTVADVAAQLMAEVEPGTVAVLAPASLVGEVAMVLDAAGIEVADPRRGGLGAPLTLLPVDLANGLEFDGVVVVEPRSIVQESPQGLRALYVAITRPTRRLAIVHALPLPTSLHPS